MELEDCPEKRLMIAVLLTQVQDYINKPKTMLHFKAAKNYIFSNDIDSDNYVFGFNFICRAIGFDPDRLRKGIEITAKKKQRERGRR